MAAIDLDGTLLGLDKGISVANREAIRLLQAHDIHIVLATGRRILTARLYQEQLGITGPIVACNGAYIEDTAKQHLLHAAYLSEPLVAEILTQGDKNNVRQIASGLSGKMFERRNGIWHREYAKYCGEPEDTEDLVRERFGEPILKIDWYQEGENKQIASLYQHWQEKAYPRLAITRSAFYNMEFMAYGTDKAQGVARVCQTLNIPSTQVLAFGDNDNDAPLLEWAGYGIAMYHATSSAQRVANLVSPESPLENAFAASVNALLML